MLPPVAKVASLVIALLVIGPLQALANPPNMDNLAKGIWVDRQAIKTLPTTGPAWDKLKADADRTLGTPNLANQDDMTNVWVLAKALVYVRTGDPAYRDAVIAAEFDGVALATLAQRDQVSLSAIKSRTSRGRVMLRDELVKCCQVTLDAASPGLEYDERKLRACAGDAATPAGSDAIQPPAPSRITPR